MRKSGEFFGGGTVPPGLAQASPGLPGATPCFSRSGKNGPAATGAPFAETLRWARDLLAPTWRTAIKRLPPTIRDLVDYHCGDPAGASGGKGVRPALVFLAAEAVGGTASAAVDAAVAVELVHNFSLLHDDVMDNDRVRRHRPTAWVVYGTPAAVLAGDALHALAIQTLAENGGPLAQWGVPCLGEALLALVAGQCADLEFADRSAVSLSECLEMAAGKTGALLGVACALGAFAGGADPQRADALRRFGGHLGLAFQLVDDLLGIWGDPALTGKPVGADLVARKRTLPVVAALTSGHPAAGELAGRYGRPHSGSTEATELARLVERAGGRDWAWAESRRQLDEALACLAAARPEPATADRLVGLAHSLADRDR